MSFNLLQLNQGYNSKENNRKIFNFKKKPLKYINYKLHKRSNNQDLIFRTNFNKYILLL